MFTQDKKTTPIAVINPHTPIKLITDAVQTRNDVNKLAKKTVLYAMHNEKSEDCFFETQSMASIFYEVYNDLSHKNHDLASYFARHLDDVYNIKIPVN